MTVSGKTRVCAVIGNPIEHSLSPVIQNAAFNALDLDVVYVAFTVKPSELANALSGIRALDILGLNVTMPHKETVIPYLDWIDNTAKCLNSVNTLHCKGGRLLGYSTDGVGALEAFRGNGADLQGKRVLMLGAGGAARVIAYTLIEAAEVEELVVLNRTVSEAEKLADIIKYKFDKKIVIGSLSSEVIGEEISNSDVLLNTTSVGMKPNVDQRLITPDSLKSDLTVMDIVYNPFETQLVKDAKMVGAKVISGVEMLIYQGAAAFEIWTGHKAPVQVMRRAALEQLNKG
ncbi:MAG: shikimate dehydrogenase [Candidatus Bathyarchaeota archaeon]|nr:shikimate dehydrogenase [Candidatus Termiticorpusculum sp.]